MALLTYVSSGVYDTMLGSATITASTATLTLAGITSAGVTAPNLVNAITGVWICHSSVITNGGDLTAEIMESGVSKATATINNADLKLGMNYLRFSTPYTFATLTASAYTCRLKNTVGSSGNVRTAASGLWFQFTYDTAAAYGTSDDIWVGGFNDAGLTPKTWTPTGTTGTWGSKATTAIGSTTQTMGAALTIGNGGTFKHDTAANCTTTLKGSVWVTAGGVFDIRASATKSIVSTFIIDSTVNGDQGIFTATGTAGGQILTTGASYDQYTRYSSGTGTAADPLIVSVAWDADVNDEIVVPGVAYNTNQLRYIKTRNSSTSFVLSATAGGAESAITNTPAVGSYISNLTRNSIIKPVTTTLGYYINNSSNTAGNFDDTRFEYSDNTSGKALTLSGGSTGGATSSFDRIVAYNTSITGGRHWLTFSGTGDPSTSITTHTGITAYNTAGTNYAGQSGVALRTTSNKTINYLLHYNGASTTTAAMLSLDTSATGNTFNNCHSYGANAGNQAAGYAISIFSSSGNTFNNCTINACRTNALYLSTGTGNVFNSCHLGIAATNTVDILCASSTLNQVVFNNCTFGSATLISNYINMLDGSRIGFHRYQDTNRTHLAYQPSMEIYSTGSGLTDTTADTTFDATSLAMKNTPLSASVYGTYDFYLPQKAGNTINVPGKLYKTAAFNGDAIMELYLDGSSTPDDTYTLSGADSVWIPFNLTADYTSGTDDRNARLRLKVRGTAGSVYLDTLFNASKTTNPIGSLDLWQGGTPNTYLVSTVASASEIAAAVWSDTNTYNAGTKGDDLNEAKDSAELASIK